MKLNEVKKVPDGTFVGVKISKKSKDDLIKLAESLDVPNILDKKDLHVTVIYSKKYLPNFKPLGKLDKSIIAKPTKFSIFGESSNCLVVELSCKDLVNRNKQIVKLHGATSDYDSYECHITLSYDVDDFDIKKLNPKSVKSIEIVEEYMENLNLDWSS